jgi:hypothetical protein
MRAPNRQDVQIGGSAGDYQGLIGVADPDHG